MSVIEEFGLHNLIANFHFFKPILLELEKRITDLESQLSIALEIMTDKQIAENQHLFNSHIDIEHSGSTTKTEGEN